MALKKTIRTQVQSATNTSKNEAREQREADDQRRKARTLAKQQQAAERIASMATEIASSVAETAASQEELTKATEQVAAGAEQASSASQQSLASVTEVAARVKTQQEITDEAKIKSAAVQDLIRLLDEDITSMVVVVAEAAEQQTEAANQAVALQQQVEKIDEAAKAVIGIADQINLLALNAAIEAGRAGKHGKGFAVVADSVRTLAEESEKNASAIQELVERFQASAKEVAAGVQEAAEMSTKEKENSEAVVLQLEDIRKASGGVGEDSGALNTMASNLVNVLVEAQKAGETIAAAAEQQSAACEEALHTLEQQTAALQGAEQTARALDEQSDELKNSTDISKSAEEVAANAEELSAGVEEISRSSGEIMTAISEINRGSEQQAAAVEQATANMSLIDKAAVDTKAQAMETLEKCEHLTEFLAENQKSVESVADGLSEAVTITEKYLADIDALEEMAKRTSKIIATISNLAIQTNMLSVTGAVEAARAGEYGKGFAVVSTDIQNLAHDAGENSEQTADMVDAISVQLDTVRKVLQKNVSEVSIIAKRAKASTLELERAAKTTAELETACKDILEGAEDVANSVKQINQALEQVAAAAEQATTATGKASTAAKQQEAGAEQMALAIEEFASVADELQSA